jgi:hypothetical protein
VTNKKYLLKALIVGDSYTSLLLIFIDSVSSISGSVVAQLYNIVHAYLK